MSPDSTAARPPRARRERPLVAAGRAKPEPVIPRDDRVIFALEGPDWQRRWTVLLRPLLLIPHLVWLWLLTVGASVVLVIGWFGALFTGRLSEGIAEFLGKVLQYQTRVAAYGPLLLTDFAPRFRLDDHSHPVAVDTEPGQFKKAAVLFRIVLMLPSSIVSFLVTIGAQVVGLVGWLVILIRGRMPQSLFQANASVLRYVARTNAFAYMLTAEQPSGLFRSDPPVAAPAPRGFDTPESDVPALPEWPRVLRLALSASAKRLLALFMVLGVLGSVGYVVGVVAIAQSASDSTSQSEAVRHAHDDLTGALRQFNQVVRTCAGDGQLECLHDADQKFALAFDDFAATVTNISDLPTQDASSVVGEARACAVTLRARAVTADAAAYDAALAGVRAELAAFDRAYAALVAAA